MTGVCCLFCNSYTHRKSFNGCNLYPILNFSQNLFVNLQQLIAMKPYRILMLLILLSALMSKAQKPGDYRTAKSGNWNSADTWEVWDGTSWNLSFLPPSFSDGEIVIRANHEISSNTPVNIDQVKIFGALIVINNTLKIENGAEDADLQVDGSLNLNFGTIEGDGTIEINGNMTFTGGTINCNVNINPIANFIMNGSNSRTLSGTINNNGTINIPDIFTLNCSNAIINNNDGGIMNIAVVDGFTFAFFNAGGQNVYNNNIGGELNKTGAGTFSFNIPTTNDGTINVNEGVLNLNGNIHDNSGEISILANAFCGVVGNATHNLNAGSSITGDGTYSIGLNGTQGNAKFNTDLSLSASYELKNGTSTGGEVTLTNAENFWRGGTISQTLNISSGASFGFTAFAPHFLNGTMNNYGDFNWETGTSMTFNDGTINNYNNFFINSQAGDNWTIFNGSGTNSFNNHAEAIYRNGYGRTSIQPSTSMEGTIQGNGELDIGGNWSGIYDH